MLSEDLFNAASKGNAQQVQALLADDSELVHATDEYGGTPLHNAANFGHDEVVTSLLEAGADPNKKDDDLRTPLHYAVLEGHEGIVKLLLEQGAEPNTKDKHGGISLHPAASRGHGALTALLLEHGARADTLDEEGKGPLYIAAYNGHVPVVELLLEGGADIDAADQEGRTPLWWAAHQGDSELLELLLENGADRNKKDRQGATPRDRALANGHQDCAELLAGAHGPSATTAELEESETPEKKRDSSAESHTPERPPSPMDAPKEDGDSWGDYAFNVFLCMLFPFVLLWYGPKYLITGQTFKGIFLIVLVVIEVYVVLSLRGLI
jgi:ankyrin repeat protein